MIRNPQNSIGNYLSPMLRLLRPRQSTTTAFAWAVRETTIAFCLETGWSKWALQSCPSKSDRRYCMPGASSRMPIASYGTGHGPRGSMLAFFSADMCVKMLLMTFSSSCKYSPLQESLTTSCNLCAEQ